MIARHPRQHHDGPTGAVGFIEDREISEVTFHGLMPPFMSTPSPSARAGSAGPAAVLATEHGTASASTLGHRILPARAAYGAFQRSVSLGRSTPLTALRRSIPDVERFSLATRGLPMVGTESRNRNVAQMGQTKHHQLEGYCGS